MTRVKICGLSREEDIDIVNIALPDYIGFVFAESSRRIDENKAAILKKRLNPQIKAVGIFVNQDIEMIAGMFDRGIIDLAQLHGDEDEDYIARLKKSQEMPIPVIKAIGVEDILPDYPANADYLLFDTLSEKRGGTGKPFNWHLLDGFSGPPFFLAGGLNVQNVSEAIKTLKPFCVDASSGVETDGIKDAGKVHEFISIVRQN